MDNQHLQSIRNRVIHSNKEITEAQERIRKAEQEILERQRSVLEDIKIFLAKEKESIIHSIGALLCGVWDFDENNIHLSREKKEVSYGKFLDPTVLKKITEQVNSPEYEDCPLAGQIKEVLGSEEGDESVKIDRIRGLLEEFDSSEEHSYGPCHDLFERIRRIIRSRKTQVTIWGEFIAPDTIIIYYQSILDSIIHRPNCDQLFFETLSMVLAHELFHAYHYKACISKSNSSNKDNLWSSKRNSYEKKELKEALADFYAVCWCMEQNFIETAGDRYQAWRKNRFYPWPYAKALEFFKNGENSYAPKEDYTKFISKFVRVLEKSINVWREALRELEKIPYNLIY